MRCSQFNLSIRPHPRRQVERGIALKGDEVEVVGHGETYKTTLTGIGLCPYLGDFYYRLQNTNAEMFHKELDRVRDKFPAMMSFR